MRRTQRTPITCLLLFSFWTLHCLAGPTLLKYVADKEDVVTRMAKAAQQAWMDRKEHVRNCTCVRHICSSNLGPDSVCSQVMATPAECRQCEGSIMDFTSLAASSPPGADPGNLSAGVVESLCAYRSLEPLMIETNPLSWLYVASIHGTSLTMPFRSRSRENDGSGDKHFDQCSRYDPRTRPWYIAASTGPKDVVILLDISLSMSTPEEKPRLTLAKKALYAILDTFSFNDYVNIVTFGSSAVPLWDETPLMQATTENLDKLRERVAMVEADGDTDFNIGFSKVFEQLLEAPQDERHSHTSHCTRHIVFLTDGVDCSRSKGVFCSISRAEGPAKVLDNIEAYQQELEASVGSRALIFTASMGADAEDSLPRQIACANQGAWSFVKEGDDPLEKMAGYYTYLAAGRPESRPVWTSIYEDFSGSGNMTTVSKAFYASDPKEGISGPMIGVVGYDVLLSELDTSEGDPEDVVKELVDRSAGCYPIELDGCQLQKLRAKQMVDVLQYQRNISSDSATCPDKLPWSRCYEYEGAWFMHFKNRLIWDKASTHCEKYGGKLASVRDVHHLSFLASLSDPRGSWLSAKKIRFKNAYKWANEEVEELDGYSFYFATPGKQERVCVFIDPRGNIRNLVADYCTLELPFICEFLDKEPTVCWKSVEIVDPNNFYDTPSPQYCQEQSSTLNFSDLPVHDEMTSDVICDLGKPVPYSELVCCTDC